MVIKIFTLEEGCLKRQPFLFMFDAVFNPVSKTFGWCHKTNVRSNRIFIIS